MYRKNSEYYKLSMHWDIVKCVLPYGGMFLAINYATKKSARWQGKCDKKLASTLSYEPRILPFATSI